MNTLHDLLGDPSSLEPVEVAERLRVASPELWRHAGAVANHVGAMAALIPELSEIQRGVCVDAAWLHDIGKLTLRRNTLLKPGPLSNDEWTEMRLHPLRGADYLEPSHTLAPLSPLVRHHHEWHDGRGYPDALRGNEVQLGARLIGVADAFDAMTSWRPYRSTLAVPDALNELRRCAGTQFDPEIVDLFVRAYNAQGTKATP
jgi:HD-GYP domain-containing protein (c-di-GMP phosphodiesterase class II)